MFLSTSLWPAGGLADFLPTTLFYKRRVARQQAKLEARRRELLLEKKRKREEAEEREWEQERQKRMNELYKAAAGSIQSQVLLGQLQQQQIAAQSKWNSLYW